jgi:hypothetical protein
MSHHLMTILQLDAKLSIREGFNNVALYLNCFFLCHPEYFFHPSAKLFNVSTNRIS